MLKNFIQNNLISLTLSIIIASFLLFHLPYLGHDFFNTDVWKWKARSYDFGSGIFSLNLEKTVQKYHPGVTLMWLGTIGIKVNNLYLDNFGDSLSEISRIFLLDTIQRLLIVSVILFCTTLIFNLLRHLFGVSYAFIATILFVCEPFFIALTRVMHLEGLMSIFMLVSALYLFTFILESQKNNLYKSALFAGLALLTKTAALYMLPFTGLMLITSLIQDKYNVHKIRKLISNFLVWLLITVSVFVILWPVVVTNPALVFNTLSRGIVEIGVDGDHIQYYFGKLVTDPGISFYPVVLFYRSSVVLLPGLIGTLYLWFANKLTKNENKFLGFLLLFTFFFLIELTLSSKKLDRYVLPALLSLSMFSSMFYYKLIQSLKLHVVGSVLLSVLIFATYYIYSPDYFSYYSPYGGGLAKGIYVLEPKWMIGVPEVLAYFKNVKTETNLRDSGADESFEEVISTLAYKEVLSVGFKEKYYTQIWPLFRENNMWAVISDLGPFAVKTRYFIYPIWDDNSGEEDRFSGLEYKDQIYIRGVPVYTVYENTSL